MTKRKVRVRYKYGIKDEKETHCGQPQGVPLLPLLFLLYISILLDDGRFKYNFGCNDSVGIILTEDSPEKAVAALQEEVDKLLPLAENHKIYFDISKSDLL